MVTTGSVIGTGPRWNSTGATSGDSVTVRISAQRSASSAREQKAEERAEQWYGAGQCDQGEADPCQEQPAEVQSHRWAEAIDPTDSARR